MNHPGQLTPPPSRVAQPAPRDAAPLVRCPACRTPHLKRGTDGTWRLRLKVLAFPASGGCNTSCTGCGHDFEVRLPRHLVASLLEQPGLTPVVGP